MRMPTEHEVLAVTIAIVSALAAVALSVLVGFASGPDTLASCQEWTDGCVVCARRADGVACSTPGIACVADKVQCLRP
jgi:hypothetical protein